MVAGRKRRKQRRRERHRRRCWGRGLLPSIMYENQQCEEKERTCLAHSVRNNGQQRIDMIRSGVERRKNGKNEKRKLPRKRRGKKRSVRKSERKSESGRESESERRKSESERKGASEQQREREHYRGTRQAGWTRWGRERRTQR